MAKASKRKIHACYNTQRQVFRPVPTEVSLGSERWPRGTSTDMQTCPRDMVIRTILGRHSRKSIRMVTQVASSSS